MNTETGEMTTPTKLRARSLRLSKTELLRELGNWYTVPTSEVPRWRAMNRAQRRRWAKEHKHLLTPITPQLTEILRPSRKA